MRTLAGILVCVVVTCSGCAGESKAKLYAVKGKVTVGGKVLTDCNVNFTTATPAKGAAPGYSGKVSSTGEYELIDSDGSKGAAPGKYKVSFAVVQSADAAQKAMMGPSTGGPPAAPEAPFPKEYGSFETTTKEVEVKAESNTIDIAI